MWFAAVILAGGAGCTGPSKVEAPPPAPLPPAVMLPLPSRPALARDAYVLLSGGGTPLTNNYSQYLQAGAIAEFFERECGSAARWIFFGAGNRTGAAPVLGDTRREVKRDGLVMQSWLPGALPNNRPATRDEFLRALREEILPTVRGGGTLYLFVGDHGELVGGEGKQESAITLWQLKRSGRGWSTDDKEVLGVAELRRVLADGLGDGRVVFCMTQCHGGGFHELGITREMAAPRVWFATPPAEAPANAFGFRLRVAGFTATDQESPAAGCDADPDPERWAGYERFMPENLFGRDLMRPQPLPRAADSLAAAHEAATLVDDTIDKPRATSDHYLAAWARTIETRLAKTLAVTAQTQQAVAAYQRAVNLGQTAAADEQLVARRELFRRFTEQLAGHLPSARDLLLNGTRSQLESAVRDSGGRGGPRGPRRGGMTELRQAWSQTLRPAWKAAVECGAVPGLTGAALEFEKRLLQREENGRDLLLPRGGTGNALLNEVYWASGYARPAALDRAKAEAITRWGAERRNRIVGWGATAEAANVRAAAAKIGPTPPVASEPRGLSRKTAAERVLFYRRVLAAWEFLVTMDAQPSLAELRALIELERTPVRPAR